MTEDRLPSAECALCEKHRGIGPLVGPVIHADDLLYVTHRATGALGYLHIDTQRHVPHLEGLTDDEAAAVGRMVARLARRLRAELEVDLVHSFVAGMAVPPLPPARLCAAPGDAGPLRLVGAVAGRANR